MSQKLQDWIRTFRLAKNTLKSEDYVTKEDIPAKKQSMKNAGAYRTPRKDKIDDKFDLDPPKYYISFKPDSEVSSTDQAEKFMDHIGCSEVKRLHSNQIFLQDVIHKG